MTKITVEERRLREVTELLAKLRLEWGQAAVLAQAELKALKARLEADIEALANKPSASISGGWKCGARASIDPPQDCDWPFCGCDPYANKVMETLQECGVLQYKG